MRWSTGDRGNINDMRGRSGGGGGMIPLGIGGFIVVALLSMFTGVDFFSMLGGGGSSNQPTAVGTSGKVNASPTEEKMVDMVDAIARDVQETWTQKLGGRYQPTKVTLFRDSINSACGYAGAVRHPSSSSASRSRRRVVISTEPSAARGHWLLARSQYSSTPLPSGSRR